MPERLSRELPAEGGGARHQTMRILMGHNYYQLRGGEDLIFEDECALLAGRGHEVIRYTRHNDVIGREMKTPRVVLSAFWSGRSLNDLRHLLRESRPDAALFMNTFPLISPAAYTACREAGIPVIQHLQNYRLTCANAFLMRDGRPCEDCLGKLFGWPGIRHACYRNSRLQSAGVAAMTATHRALGTWQRGVDLFLTPSEFTRRKLIQAGLPGERIRVKPNFVRLAPEPRSGAGEYALFVGRLSHEKGLDLILDAWRELRDVPLRIAGDGPLRAQIAARVEAEGLEKVEVLGPLELDQVLAQMRDAAFLIFASRWYETFGRVIVEAFACGVPVLCSDLGAGAELVQPGQTGLHFRASDAADLAHNARYLWQDASLRERMGKAARGVYLDRYTAERAYENLMAAFAAVQP